MFVDASCLFGVCHLAQQCLRLIPFDFGVLVCQVNKLIDQLGKFGFATFTSDFLDQMKVQLKNVVDLAKMLWDPDNSPGAKEYEEKRLRRTRRVRLRATPRRRQDFEPPVYWRKDPGERARRIWEWWRQLLCRNRKHRLYSNIFSWFEAVKLVVLVQPSSAAAERVFSVLKLVRDSCKDNMVESTLELRVMTQVNSGIAYS